MDFRRLANRGFLGAVVVTAAIVCATRAQDAGREEGVRLEPGQVLSLAFQRLPKTLHEMNTGRHMPATVTARLPDNYGPNGRYPLLVFLHGGDGGDARSIGWVHQITGGRDYIAAVMPLFKLHMLDESLPGKGLLVLPSDYPVIAPAYTAMLDRLEKVVPNIRREGSTLAGFSNGGHTIALLIDRGDRQILDRFENFALIDGGFALQGAGNLQGKNLLLLMGDESNGPVGQMRQFSANRLRALTGARGVAFEVIRMPNTGHAFGPDHFPLLRKWMESPMAARQGRPVTEKAPLTGDPVESR